MQKDQELENYLDGSSLRLDALILCLWLVIFFIFMLLFIFLNICFALNIRIVFTDCCILPVVTSYDMGGSINLINK